MSELERLKKEYKLSKSQTETFSQLIIKQHTRGITPVKTPHAIILGGQPGSGKGELITKAQEIIGKNLVICNADEYRNQHPKSAEIITIHEKYYPAITAEYAQGWNNNLREYCEDNKLNYILETTFSSHEVMNKTINAIKAKGYKVSIMLLSVHHNLSFLGTRLRYEGMKATDGYGRLVNNEQHDQKYEAIINTLEKVIQANLYDNLYIYARAGRKKLKGTTIGLRELSKNGENPLKDYLDERGKLWSENDLRFFTSDILQLIKQMIWRDASNEELKEIFDVFDLENVEGLLAPEI